MRRAGVTFLLIVVLSSAVDGQDLSTDIIRSEDELYLWWRQGAVDSVEYELLREIMLSGIDSTTTHWLEYVPNLSWFTPLTAELGVPLEQLQKQAFLREDRTARSGISGQLRYRLNYRLDSTDQTRDRFWIGVGGDAGWQTSARLQRDSDGDDRLAYRAFRWRPAHKGWLREVVLGNYSRRLGLGTIVGYRGKLLDYSRTLKAESMLHPTYSGSNGLYVSGRFDEYNVETLLSHQRGVSFRLATIAAQLSRATGRWRPRLALGFNRLARRSTGSTITDLILSAGSRYRYRGGYLDVEGALQCDTRSGPSALVLEGKHRFSRAQVEYSGWGYSDGFIDLSSGSRAAAMSRPDSLTETGFAFNSRRRGQEGMLIRTIVVPDKDWRLSTSILAASFDRRFLNLQLLATLSYQFSDRIHTQLRYLDRTRRRPDENDGYTRRQLQLESRYDSADLDLLGRIAYNNTHNLEGFLSLSGEMEFDEPTLGRLHLSARVAELGAESLRVSRWYAFAGLQQPVFDGVEFAVRLSHQYQRSSKSPHWNMITMEVQAGW